MTRPGTEPFRLLHIGLPKTGTNAIQAALDERREDLAALGVHNASSSRHDFAAAKFAAGSLEKWRRGDAAGAWERNARSFRESTAPVTILSSEAFSEADSEHIAGIRAAVGERVTIVVTLRSLAPLLASWWQQRLRAREFTPFEEWVVHRIGEPPGKDSRTVFPRQNLPQIVENWGRAFGEDRIVFVIPDPSNRAALLREFESLLQLPEDTLPVVDDGNASLPFPEAELLRNINRHYTANGGDPTVWMRTVYLAAKPHLKRMKGLEPHRIQVPRWVAERCNEITSDWLAAIEGKPITIRGDVADLYVDPLDYPEQVEVPTTVNIDGAAALAEILFTAGIDYRGAPRSAPQRDLQDYSAGELARELRSRIARRIRRRG